MRLCKSGLATELSYSYLNLNHSESEGTVANQYRRPPTPPNVERLLRQEAGFGCAKCGHPYIEYHHIIPYAEDAHFRPEDMIALCGNCHPAVSKFGRDRQYAFKNDPHNIRKGLLNGALEYDKRDLIFRVGGNWYENVPIILRYKNTPIVTCSLKEGQAKDSLNLFDAFGKIIFSVVENDVSFRIDELWDFEYAHNLVVVRYGPRKIALRMDFRSADATIEGNVWIGSQLIKLGREETILGSDRSLGNSRMRGGSVGIQFGNPSAQNETAAPQDPINRTRRNALCPCGSKKRFKHCCGSYS